MNSARGSSVYNSRRTSLDNSGFDMQHIPTNIIEGVESTYEVPGNNSVRSGGGASSGTAVQTPVDMNSETTSNVLKLSKQSSLDKSHSTVAQVTTNVQAALATGGSNSAADVDSYRHVGGLTQSSLADLEKKLAALRNVENSDEVIKIDFFTPYARGYI